MTARQKQEINTNAVRVKQRKTRHSSFVVQPEVTYAAISTEIQRLPDEDPEPLGNQPIVKLIQEMGENVFY